MYGKGALEFYRGKYGDAVESFNNSLSETKKKNVQNYYSGKYMLARSYYENGQLAEAVKEFEALLLNYGSYRMYWAGRDVLIYYYLGLAYEESNWHDKAVENYQKFINQWKEASTEIDELTDAKQRIAALTS